MAVVSAVTISSVAVIASPGVTPDAPLSETPKAAAVSVPSTRLSSDKASSAVMGSSSASVAVWVSGVTVVVPSPPLAVMVVTKPRFTWLSVFCAARTVKVFCAPLASALVKVTEPLGRLVFTVPSPSSSKSPAAASVVAVSASAPTDQDTVTSLPVPGGLPVMVTV